VDAGVLTHAAQLYRDARLSGWGRSRPAQVAQARRIIGEPLQQLMPVARVIDPDPRMLTIHALKLPRQGDGSG